jgi:soluble lytic murein transglycosylase-like protein
MRGLLRHLLVGVALALPAAPASADGLEPALQRLRAVARGDWPRSEPRRPAPPRYIKEITAAAERHRVPPALLVALVRAESNFNPRAVSSAGARGLGQLMPATARELGVTEPFDPVQNLNGSARYLSEQLHRFGSAQLALAAYHAGPNYVERRPHRLPRTTRIYVARVLRFERDYRDQGIR